MKFSREETVQLLEEPNQKAARQEKTCFANLGHERQQQLRQCVNAKGKPFRFRWTWEEEGLRSQDLDRVYAVSIPGRTKTL